MSETTTIRVHRSVRDSLNELAASRGETVARGALLLKQESIGLDLQAPLREDELAWLDADAG